MKITVDGFYPSNADDLNQSSKIVRKADYREATPRDVSEFKSTKQTRVPGNEKGEAAFKHKPIVRKPRRMIIKRRLPLGPSPEMQF
jgi:hypothetical protein